MTAIQHQHRREGLAIQERVEAAMHLSTMQNFQFWLAFSTVLRGWALAESGQSAEGIADIRQGLATWQAMGVEIARPYILLLLAEAYEKNGQAAEGLNRSARHWYTDTNAQVQVLGCSGRHVYKSHAL
jgi:predicted ATPase